ncbi:MAG: glycosyltransferase family A protein [Phycisphaerales bacterium]
MDLSVIIPTHARPRKLAACLARLARQTLAGDRYEVLVGVDGPDEGSAAAAREAWGRCGAALTVIPCPRAGYNAARNALLPQARGRYLVSLNDDVLPEPGFLEEHLRAHAEREAAERGAGRGAVITGYSPFVRFEDETVFDVLARETSMIFFYDQMVPAEDQPGPAAGGPTLRGGSSGPAGSGPAAERRATREPEWDWGFRHCYGLNFSAPAGAVREVGGFVAFPLAYGYDDIELAFRLRERLGLPVLFRARARAEHDHRYTPRGVLEREERLGAAAWHFAGVNPAFAGAVFGRDIRSEGELAYSREFVEREAGLARLLEGTFLALGEMAAGAIEGAHRGTLLAALYQHHLPLKRYWWRRGLLGAADGAATRAPERALASGV